ncbi:MAG: hypothetical protein Q8Q03_01150 [bacterium]|nr:hypothetical protein [bacterium]
MKKYLSIILIVTVVLAIGGFALTPQIAEASCVNLTGFDINDCIVSGLAALANYGLTIASWFVAMAGLFLSVSINLTLHIKELYDKTPAIGLVWTVIRDLSSIFIIFMLLYASIVMILGVKGPSFGSLIVNIFLAGILINFSLFFTKVAIDASNLISLQFYRAIAPNTEFLSGGLSKTFSDGGLSDVFMQSLKIPRLYDNNGVLKSQNPKMGIIIAGVGGIAIMMTAAFSFLAAAIAFSVRVAILMFLMAFSSVYFVGWIFPDVKKNLSDKWLDYLIKQCTFMPAYLLLMYVALRLLNGDPNAPVGTGGFMAFLSSNTSNADFYGNEGTFNLSQVGIIIQYVIALLFINAPLIVALQMGGKSVAWANGIKEKVRGVVGRNTAGRLGRFAGNKFDSMAAAAQSSTTGRAASSVLRNLGISQVVRGRLAQAEGSTYGGKQNLSDIQKENKERSRFIAGVQRGKAQAAVIGAVVGSRVPPTPAQMQNFRSAVGKMSNKDFEDMDFDTLKNPVFAGSLSSKQADSLLDGDILTDAQKTEFKAVRENRLTTILGNVMPGALPDIQEHIKKISGKELSKMSAVLTNINVINSLAPSQLKEMEDIDGSLKKVVGDHIFATAPANHKAKGWIRHNRAEWS